MSLTGFSGADLQISAGNSRTRPQGVLPGTCFRGSGSSGKASTHTGGGYSRVRVLSGRWAGRRRAASSTTAPFTCTQCRGGSASGLRGQAANLWPDPGAGNAERLDSLDTFPTPPIPHASANTLAQLQFDPLNSLLTLLAITTTRTREGFPEARLVRPRSAKPRRSDTRYPRQRTDATRSEST